MNIVAQSDSQTLQITVEDNGRHIDKKSIEQMGNAKEWLKLAKEYKYANFQAYDYSFVELYQAQGRISISYDSIILAMEFFE